MLFDAGQYGIIEVDESYTDPKTGFQVGVVKPNTWERTTYTYGGPRLGCSVVRYANTTDMDKLKESLRAACGQVLLEMVRRGEEI